MARHGNERRAIDPKAHVSASASASYRGLIHVIVGYDRFGSISVVWILAPNDRFRDVKGR